MSSNEYMQAVKPRRLELSKVKENCLFALTLAPGAKMQMP